MNKSLIHKQFGAHAAAYSTSDVHAKGESLARLAEIVAPQPTWHVLDIATGAGHTALALAPHVARVVAADLTPEMLAETKRLAAERGLGNVETAIADAECLPFAEASFDLAVCRLAAHHFPHPTAFVAEASRVLKPSGVLGLVDNISPDAESLPGCPPDEIARAAVAYNEFEALRDPSHARALTVAEWRTAFEKHGFAITHVERATKALDFKDYAERLACSAAVTERLGEMLRDSPPALVRFLGPHVRNDRLWFILHEALIVARKPN